MQTAEPEILTPNEARGARKTRHMPMILGISTVAAVIVVFAVFAGFAA